MSRLKVLAGLFVLLVAGICSAVAIAGSTGGRINGRRTRTATTATTVSPSPTPVPVGATLFSDEFNGVAGSKPSAATWLAPVRTSTNSGALFNGFAQFSEDGQGNLVVTAAKNSSGQWVCGEMYTAATFSGPRYVEDRARVPAGTGTWAAPLWEIHKGGASFENDVNEQLGREPQTYHATLHNWIAGTQSGKSIATPDVLSAGFHTYGAAVYADRVDFYYDGKLETTITAAAIGFTDLTQYAENEIVTLNMGGSWAGTPTIAGPVSMLVDYVRVYALA